MLTAEPAMLAERTEPDDGQGSCERVYRGILRALFEGRLAPGQRLSEPDLVRQFSTGRGTVREVLNRLAAEGIVVLVRHRGATVSMLSRRQAVDLLEVVAVLFALVGRRAAEGVRHGGDVIELTKALSDVDRPLVRTPSHMALVENFYGAVMNLGNNREARSALPAMKVYILRTQMRPFQDSRETYPAADFKLVAQAILSGNGAVAEVACRAHVERTLNEVAAMPDHAFDKDR